MHAHLCMSGAPGRRGLAHEPTEVQLLRAAQNAQVSLASGVTTIRDLGGTGCITQIVRDAIAQGIIVGPRIVSCGRLITTTAGHGWSHGLRADTAEEMKKAARILVEERADVLKVAASGGGGTPGSNVAAPQYSADELSALVAEARRLGKRTAAHAIGTVSIRNAVVAGIDTIEHCGWMGMDGRLEVDESTIGLMLKQGTTVVPTVTVWYRSAYDNFDNMSEDRKRMRAVREERTAVWTRMHAAGIRFATGPDTGVDDTYWDNLAWELELMVERMKISALDAIAAATRNSAEGLGLEHEIGTVQSGKVADLLLVEGDPAADITVLRRIKLVLRAGKPLVRRGALAPHCHADLPALLPVRTHR
jgi:imidazolonepropionase-like amidohydrolase